MQSMPITTEVVSSNHVHCEGIDSSYKVTSGHINVMCERDVIVMSERDQGVIVIYYYAQISGGACDLEHGYILYSQKLIHVVDI
jgi:hypothetical protein